MRAPAAAPKRRAPMEAIWACEGRPTATPALGDGEADPEAAMELAAPEAELRRELMMLLTGAVAVLSELVREEPTLAAEELAPTAEEERPAAMEEAAEAGKVVATPPMVVVMRSDVGDGVEVTEARDDDADDNNEEVLDAPDEGQTVLVPAEEQICW